MQQQRRFADDDVADLSCSLPRALLWIPSRNGALQGCSERIHHVPEDLKIAYLQGLFSADGCIRTDTRAIEPEVMLASSSASLLRSVQLLLSDLGMTSRISWMHPTGRKNPQGQLHLYNQQARNFLRSSASRARKPKRKRPSHSLRGLSTAR